MPDCTTVTPETSQPPKTIRSNALPLLSEERELVDVVRVEDLTSVEPPRRTVVRYIERVCDRIEIIGRRIDLMRIGVGQLEGKPMLVLHAHTYLERVVVEVSFVLFLSNAAEARELSIQVGIWKNSRLTSDVYCCVGGDRLSFCVDLSQDQDRSRARY